MLLGAGSVVFGVLEPQQEGVPSGFIVSTVGITAIALGVHTVKRARWGSATARAFGRGGAILGGVGTALMAYALVAAALTAVDVSLPALSLPIEHRWSASGSVLSSSGVAVAPEQAPAVPTPRAPTAATAPPVPTTIEAERSAVVQSAGTLAFVMRQSFGSGPYPSSLAVGMASPERILLPDGTGLAAVPDGARILYSTSSDGSAWSITIIGARFGAVATYSSAVGTVESG
ncbi:hypothetical protein [Curtobacterium pusillum]|uniref:hypothetical protein n=1 Tax=Curtobacterium pusillum TaxID=69373 RepID=UPI0011A2FC41|nr:hypothetical protein [Curtobacterium pusillum]